MCDGTPSEPNYSIIFPPPSDPITPDDECNEELWRRRLEATLQAFAGIRPAIRKTSEIVGCKTMTDAQRGDMMKAMLEDLTKQDDAQTKIDVDTSMKEYKQYQDSLGSNTHGSWAAQSTPLPAPLSYPKTDPLFPRTSGSQWYPSSNYLPKTK